MQSGAMLAAGLVLAIAIGGTAIFMARQNATELETELASRVEKEERATKTAADSHARLARIEESMRALEARLDAAEQRARAAVEALRAAAVNGGSEKSAVAPAGFKTPEDKTAATATGEAEADEFRGLLARFFADGEEEMSTDEQERFWNLAKSGALESVIADLKDEVEKNPQSTEPRMQLAQSYIAKLLTVPGGPERGVWSARAEEQWRNVIEIDPSHYKAHLSLGVNYSFYPPFLNKAGEAIEWLEKSRALLRNEQPDDDQAQNFTTLARLYQQQGKLDQAREALNAGLERLPENESLKTALQALPAAKE